MISRIHTGVIAFCHGVKFIKRIILYICYFGTFKKVCLLIYGVVVFYFILFKLLLEMRYESGVYAKNGCLRIFLTIRKSIRV